MDDNLAFFIVPAFFVIFPLFWMGIVKLISLFGWRKFVNDRMMRTEPPPDSEKFSGQSISIGSGFAPSNYGNCITGWVHHSGLYLRPMWLFQFGHPLIQLNWNDITDIKESTILFRKCYSVSFWKDLPKIRLYGRIGKAAKQAWESNSHQRHHGPRG